MFRRMNAIQGSDRPWHDACSTATRPIRLRCAANVATTIRYQITMKLRSQHLTSSLKMVSLFTLLALFSPLFGQDEAPSYENYEAFTQSAGFSLFTINNLWLRISAALAFLTKQRATFRNVILTDAAEVWQEKWKTVGPPLVFLFDRDGKLAGRWLGKFDLAEVERKVADVLAEKP